ncbi:MAG: hypothetical protein WC843_00320 [Candidatus Gracilibacteria bacterium]|jgi:hypothetical protein
MLLNKKLLMGICNTIAVLLLLEFLLNIAMYIWAFFGTPALPLFDVKSGIVSYYILLTREATVVFLYMIVGGLAALVKGSKLPENFKK